MEVRALDDSRGVYIIYNEGNTNSGISKIQRSKDNSEFVNAALSKSLGIRIHSTTSQLANTLSRPIHPLSASSQTISQTRLRPKIIHNRHPITATSTATSRLLIRHSPQNLLQLSQVFSLPRGRVLDEFLPGIGVGEAGIADGVEDVGGGGF